MGKIRLGCSAVLFNLQKDGGLLTRRSDNRMWCLPGGILAVVETVAEGCEREFYEETGLKLRVLRMTCIYSDPDQLVIFPDENKAHIIAINIEVELVGGEMGLSNGTTDITFSRSMRR